MTDSILEKKDILERFDSDVFIVDEVEELFNTIEVHPEKLPEPVKKELTNCEKVVNKADNRTPMEAIEEDSEGNLDSLEESMHGKTIQIYSNGDRICVCSSLANVEVLFPQSESDPTYVVDSKNTVLI